MALLEETLKKAVADAKVPNAVVFATNGDGSFEYSHAVGQSSLLEDAQPATKDSVFLLASSTKLLTSIAALQIVELGLVTLDEDLTPKLPELGRKQILTGFDADDKPTFADRTQPFTLRQFLTHTAGVLYDGSTDQLAKYRDQLGRAPAAGDTVADRGGWPFGFEPGSQWCYGMGLDWAGKLIETLTGRDLDAHMQEHIFGRVGAASLTFWPDAKPDLKARKAALTTRTPDGRLAAFTQPFITDGAKEAFGGHGCYGSMRDYVKVLRSLLANDGVLLKPATVEMMFAPQLSPETARSLKEFKASARGQAFIGEFTEGIDLQYGLGGAVFMQSDEGKRTKGTMSWGGVCNTFWIIDREADLALTFGTQVLPPGDKTVASVISEVEKEIYKMAGKA